MYYTDSEDQMTTVDEPMNIIKHPWRRFFARTFDLSLYGLIITSMQLLVFRMDTTGKPFASIIESFLACLIMVALEPALLSTIGTTPGKWIFGLVLRNRDGSKLTYFEGFSRTLGVFGAGLGYGIPLYNIYTEIKSYQICDAGEELPWDEGFSYKLKDTSILRVLGFLLGNAIIFGLVFLLAAQASLPINRGNISVEEYYENCNDYIKYNEIELSKKLTNKGEWIEKSNNTFYIGLNEYPTHEVIYKQGRIEKVTVSLEVENEDIIYNFNHQLAMAYTAFVGADKSVNSMELLSNEAVGYINDCFNDFEFMVENYKITNQVTHEGYRDGSSLLFAIEEQKQYFSLVFTIERIQ